MADHEGWRPISSEELGAELNSSLTRMSEQQRRLWDVIRITPEKWQQDPYGSKSRGFWVVALLGTTAIWYNDIEDGFNRSHYSSYGTIDEYWCNQDELQWTIQQLLDLITTGKDAG